MRGLITGKHVILHSASIVRLWGLRTCLHCLWAAMTRRPVTFLGVLYPDGRRARWTPTRSPGGSGSAELLRGSTEAGRAVRP